MEPNQVDGIRKLSKEEIKRSRDIVLDTIGEAAQKQAPLANDYLINSGNITKRMDGLSEYKKTPDSIVAESKEKEKVLSIINEPKKVIFEPASIKPTPTPSVPLQPKKAVPSPVKPSLFSRLASYYKKRSEEKRVRQEQLAVIKKQNDERREQEKEQKKQNKARLEKEKIENQQKAKQQKAREKQQEAKEKEEKQARDARLTAIEKQKIVEKTEQDRQAREAQQAAIEKQKNIEADKKKLKIQKAGNTAKKAVKAPIINLNESDPAEPGEIKEIISIAGYEMMEKEGVDFVADLKSEKIQKEKKLSAKPDKEKIDILRAEERKRKEEALEIKRAEKQKQRAERKEKIKEFAKSLNRRVILISRRSIYVTTITFVSCISIYFLILISIVQFDIDNAATRQIAKYIPIPAYISADGIMEYFKYKDMKTGLLNETGDQNKLENEIKMAVVKRLVLEKLANRYRLLFNVEKDFVPQLTTQLAFDMDVNIVPINRIKKIKQLIDKQGDFVRVASKYGDELGQVTTDYDNSQKLYYFDEVKNLELGQVSDTVLTPDGYYIFKCFDKDSASIALSYVFIKSNTLDDYINEEVKGYKLISFVD